MSSMDIGESIIETGVDKLVRLIKDRGRIALADAATELGVSASVIHEWADFLDEEGVISIEYKLTKPYLVERKLTKKEVQEKAKEFTSKKDVFVRKAEVNLTFLEKQAEGLKKLKDEFDRLKNDLGLDVDTVKEELKELEQYQQLKLELEKEIQEQKSTAKARIEELTSHIIREQKRYEEVVEGVKKSKEEITREREQAKSIEESERLLSEKLNNMKNMISLMEKKLSGENSAIKNSETHIERLSLIMEDVKKRVEEEKSVIVPLVEKSKEQERKVLEIQNRIIKKLSENEKKFSHAQGITKKFKEFFEKKLAALNLVYKINKDRDELEKGLMELIRKARSFQLIVKKGDVGKEMLDLEKKFTDIDKKRSMFEDELKKLTSFFSKGEAKT